MSFEKIVINFDGFIDVAKEDLKLTEINPESGKMDSVDTTKLSVNEIIEGVKKGLYYVSFENCFAVALDGETNLELEDGTDD